MEKQFFAEPIDMGYFKAHDELYYAEMDYDYSPYDFWHEDDHEGVLVNTIIKYNLGDVQTNSLREYLISILEQDEDITEDTKIEQIVNRLIVEGYSILPCSFYEHSGVTIHYGSRNHLSYDLQHYECADDLLYICKEDDDLPDRYLEDMIDQYRSYLEGMVYQVNFKHWNSIKREWGEEESVAGLYESTFKDCFWVASETYECEPISEEEAEKMMAKISEGCEYNYLCELEQAVQNCLKQFDGHYKYAIRHILLSTTNETVKTICKPLYECNSDNLVDTYWDLTAVCRFESLKDDIYTFYYEDDDAKEQDKAIQILERVDEKKIPDFMHELETAMAMMKRSYDTEDEHEFIVKNMWGKYE